jgi:DNA-directed RNA polymerase
MNLNSIPERREIPLWLSRLLFETDYTVKILAFFGGPIAMGMICLFTNYGITAALFGLLLILIIFNIVMDQRFINFVFKYSIWFNEASMQLHDSLVQMNNWWLDRSNWWLDRSGIKNENNNTPWLNNEALKGKVHDYEPYHGPKADGKIAGFNSILTQYNSLFSSAYNIPSFNLLNQNLDSNLPTVQIDDGILSASIQNLHIGIPLGTLLQWDIMQSFQQQVDLLVEQMKLNNNSKVISSLLNRPEMKSMFRIPPVNDNLFSPYSKLSSNLKLVRGPKGQRTFSTIIKTEKEKDNIKLNTVSSGVKINPLNKFDITKDINNIDTQLENILNKLTDLTKLLVAYNIVLKNDIITTTINTLTKAIIDILNQTKFDTFIGGNIMIERINEIQNELNKTQKISAKSLVNRNSNKKNSIFNHDILLESNPLIWEVVESWLGLCRKQEITIRDKYIERLADTCLIWLTLNKEKNVLKLRDEAEDIIAKIFKENKTKKAGGRKNPNRLKPLTNSDYRGYIESEIAWAEEDAIEAVYTEINNKLKGILDISKEEDINERIQEILNSLNEPVTNLRKISAELIEIRYKGISRLDYSKVSMQHVKERLELIKNIEKENIDINKLQSTIDSIEKINNFIENLKGQTNIDKIDKFVTTADGFHESLQNILKDNIDLDTKQLNIEKLCLAYDTEWFEKELDKWKEDKAYEIESLVLHDLYKSSRKSLEILLQNYINNNHKKLIKEINSPHSDQNDLNRAFSVLIHLAIGSHLCLNLGFTTAIKNINREGGHGVPNVEIMDKVGRTIMNQFKHMFNPNKENRFDHLIKPVRVKELDPKTNIIHNKYNRIPVSETSNELVKLIDSNYERIISQDEISTRKIMMEIGHTIITLLLKNTKVFGYETDRITTGTNIKDITKIYIKDSYYHRLNLSIINITQLPMLIEPNRPNPDGTNYLPYKTPEITHYSNTFNTVINDSFKNKFKTENLGGIVQTMISLNSTAFRINKEVLSLLRKEWENQNSKLFKGFNNKIELTEKMTTEERSKALSHNSTHYQYNNTLRIATLFSDHKFYLPTFADFRGRIYTYSNYLSYQGTDLARSLLLFDKGDNEISNEGINYMKLYLSNLANQDKESWNAKIKWVNNNLATLYERFIDYSEGLENNSLNNEIFNNMLINLKEPFQFISMLHALGKLCILNPEKGIKESVHNPILLDASCNGLQHLASMTRDVKLARDTNVLGKFDSINENKETKANDLYTLAAEFIQNEVDSNNDLPDSIKSIKFTRKLVKKSIMTIPYNVSLIGIQAQIRSHTTEIREFTRPIFYLPKEFSKLDKPIRLYPSDVNKVGLIVYTVINDKMPTLKTLKTYLQEMSKIILRLGSWVYWITPTGLKVNLSNVKLGKERFSSRLYSGNKPITISLPTDQLDKVAINRSLMPNLIHSLDSANIQLFVNNLHKENINIPFYTIHDCFASLPNSMGLLERLVKEAFIEIYFSDNTYVQTLHNQLLDQIRDLTETKLNEDGEEICLVPKGKNKTEMVIPQLPSTFIDPKLNELFIKGLRNSAYFIG